MSFSVSPPVQSTSQIRQSSPLITDGQLLRKWWKPSSEAHARLARLSVPKITVYQHVLKKYSKLGASTPVLRVFGEELYGFASCFLSLALLL